MKAHTKNTYRLTVNSRRRAKTTGPLIWWDSFSFRVMGVAWSMEMDAPGSVCPSLSSTTGGQVLAENEADTRQGNNIPRREGRLVDTLAIYKRTAT